MTSEMRASGRSTLLITRTTGSRASSALRSTKRVCGSGPSLASTSSSTPSTIVSPRSTSPPKSAWPGVSMMLIFVPPWRTAVFLARVVIPFSRSRSPESMTRSCTSWFSRNAPDCHSIASTSVVLPWSTCAMIATLRMSERSATPAVSATWPPRAAGASAGRAPRSQQERPVGEREGASAALDHGPELLVERGPPALLDREVERHRAPLREHFVGRLPPALQVGAHPHVLEHPGRLGDRQAMAPAAHDPVPGLRDVRAALADAGDDRGVWQRHVPVGRRLRRVAEQDLDQLALHRGGALVLVLEADVREQREQ